MFLERFPHVLKVEFVSKEKAKKIYMENGNEDWSKVLDHNPLPDRYHITINAQKYTLTDIEEMKVQIMERISYCSEVDYPRSFFK